MKIGILHCLYLVFRHGKWLMIFHHRDRMRNTYLLIHGVPVILFSRYQEAEVLIFVMVLMLLLQLEHHMTPSARIRLRQQTFLGKLPFA